MKALLLPLIMLIVGSGTGIGAGIFLLPEHVDEISDINCPAPENHEINLDESTPIGEPETDSEYAKLSNQFVIPVVSGGTVSSLVVLSLSVEVPIGGKDLVYSHEPKLRDEILQILFDHANSGGFNGAFTESTNMRVLREGLKSAAQTILGASAKDVLIVEIVRQDA